MNAPAPASASASTRAARVAPHAAHAFGGVWRLTVRRYFTLGHWLMVGGALAVLALLAIGSNPASESGRYVEWMARFYACFLVPILAFISGGGVMRDDLKADAVDYIFTRPVSRPAYVFFRYAAHVACAQVDFLLALAVLVVVGVSFDAPGLWDAVPLILLAQIVVLAAFSAFGFLAGMLTSRYVIVGLLYGGIIEVGVGNVPTQLNRLSMTRQVLGLLRPLLGDEGGNAGVAAVEGLSGPATVALLFVFAAVMLAATAALFAVKELAGASGREA